MSRIFHVAKHNVVLFCIIHIVYMGGSCDQLSFMHVVQVHFPDVEKAEWLNKIIRQMWPFVGYYTEDLLRKKVEPSVQQSLPKSLTPFRFENIDIGDIVSECMCE